MTFVEAMAQSALTGLLVGLAMKQPSPFIVGCAVFVGLNAIRAIGTHVAREVKS